MFDDQHDTGRHVGAGQTENMAKHEVSLRNSSSGVPSEGAQNLSNVIANHDPKVCCLRVFVAKRTGRWLRQRAQWASKPTKAEAREEAHTEGEAEEKGATQWCTALGAVRRLRGDCSSGGPGARVSPQPAAAPGPLQARSCAVKLTAYVLCAGVRFCNAHRSINYIRAMR